MPISEFSRRDDIPNNSTLSVCGLVFTGVAVPISAVGVYFGWKQLQRRRKVGENQTVPDETGDTQLASMHPLLSTETATANDYTPVYALTVNGDVHYHSNVGPPCPAAYEVDEDNSSSLRLPYPQLAVLLPPQLEAPATTHNTEHYDL